MSDHPTTAPGEDEYGPVEPTSDRHEDSDEGTAKSPDAAENDDD